MVRQHISIIGRSDQAIVGSSIMSDNVPTRIQSRIDMSKKLLDHKLPQAKLP